MKELIIIIFVLSLGFTTQAQTRSHNPSGYTTVTITKKGDKAIDEPLYKDATAQPRTRTNATSVTVRPANLNIQTEGRTAPRTSVDVTKTQVYVIPKRKERKRDDR